VVNVRAYINVPGGMSVPVEFENVPGELLVRAWQKLSNVCWWLAVIPQNHEWAWDSSTSVWSWYAARMENDWL